MQKEKNHSQPNLRGILQHTTSIYQYLNKKWDIISIKLANIFMK